jgi:dUTP pyrophosphatase
MKFLIKPHNDQVRQMYQNHSTYHEGDSGLDLFLIEDQVIPAGKTVIVDLGISCQLLAQNVYSHVFQKYLSEKYFSYNMYPRSSISKTPLRLANSVGLCDAAYTGPLKAALHNTDPVSDFTIKKGERYVQLAYPNLEEVSFELVDELRDTTRGAGGFGSTGK